jgi:hypothetical protein
MKRTLFVFLFFAIIPNLLFAQFTQQGPKLVGTSFVGNRVEQGGSVAISSDGNTAIVGGPDDNSNAGAVWVFTRSGGVWTQQGPKLVGTGIVGIAAQGGSVAISSDGNTAIVGGIVDNGQAGAVWVFTRSGGVWTQQGSKLVGTGGDANSRQGRSVAISSDGNTAIEGGELDNNGVGALWVFTRSGGVWTQQGPKLVGSGAVNGLYGAGQGNYVAISSDGNTLIEAGSEDNGGVGAVWVFTRSGGVWTQQGQKLVGTGGIGALVRQGVSVSISSDGNTLVEGGSGDYNRAGAVWVFTRSGGVWTQQGPKLVGTGAVGNAGQGWSVAISPDGNSFVEGGGGDNSEAGAVWVFTRSGGVWTQLGTKLVGSGAVGDSSLQGISVAISSEGTLIEGGPWDNSDIGAAWVFVYPGIGITPISSEVPKSFQLMQNYPNPFNPSTRIEFGIPKQGFVKLTVYNSAGKEVTSLVNELLSAGNYDVPFDASGLSSGVYFYKLSAGNFVETKKMILVK